MTQKTDPSIATQVFKTSTCDEAYARTLEHVLMFGHALRTHPTDTPDDGRGSTEIIGLQVEIDDVRNRILQNKERQLNIVTAISRFVWMIAGSDRLEDIAFYEPKVRRFSDNDLSVPGSNYGTRLFQPRPGVNQIEGVIGRLKVETGSRRTAAVIWTPEDAVRESNDIPCAFGTFYFVRNGQLVAITVMRSNNAYILLPYNTFEFGLVAEIIATSVGVKLGPYVHFAASMHIFDGNEREKSEKVVSEYHESLAKANSEAMPAMPSDPDPLQQAYELAKLDARLRHDHRELHQQTEADLLERGAKELNDYWLSFYRVLLAYSLIQADRITAAKRVTMELPHYFKSGIEFHIKLAEDKNDAGVSPPVTQQNLFGESEAVGSKATAVAAAFAPTANEERAVVEHLEQILDEIELDTQSTISRAEARLLRMRLISERPIAVAARSESNDSASASDKSQLSREEVEEALKKFRDEQNTNQG